jgi:hypothetical protein
VANVWRISSSLPLPLFICICLSVSEFVRLNEESVSLALGYIVYFLHRLELREPSLSVHQQIMSHDLFPQSPSRLEVGCVDEPGCSSRSAIIIGGGGGGGGSASCSICRTNTLPWREACNLSLMFLTNFMSSSDPTRALLSPVLTCRTGNAESEAGACHCS